MARKKRCVDSFYLFLSSNCAREGSLHVNVLRFQIVQTWTQPVTQGFCVILSVKQAIKELQKCEDADLITCARVGVERKTWSQFYKENRKDPANFRQHGCVKSETDIPDRSGEIEIRFFFVLDVKPQKWNWAYHMCKCRAKACNSQHLD